MEHCNAPLGTVEIDENQDAPWYGYLAQYQLPSTVPLLRLIVQQSNCFVVVDRGQGLSNELNEQALSQSGELRSTSQEQGGQMVAADYTMSPSINFSQQGGSGLGGLVGFVPVVGGARGGYSTTPEGKLVTAAFMDSYNQMVDSLRNYRQQTIQGGLGNGGTLGVQGGIPPQ